MKGGSSAEDDVCGSGGDASKFNRGEKAFMKYAYITKTVQQLALLRRDVRKEGAPFRRQLKIEIQLAR